MRPVLYIIGFVLAACLVVRAIVEPFVINTGNPATYANDWGGPSLFGVLAVHCGPGLVALGLVVILLARRRRRGRRGRSADPADRQHAPEARNSTTRMACSGRR